MNWTNPLAATLIGQYTTSDVGLIDGEMGDGFAAVRVQDSVTQNVRLLDLSNPAAPVARATISFTHFGQFSIKHVYARGRRIFIVKDGDAPQVWVYNVTNLNAPLLLTDYAGNVGEEVGMGDGDTRFGIFKDQSWRVMSVANPSVQVAGGTIPGTDAIEELTINTSWVNLITEHASLYRYAMANPHGLLKSYIGARGGPLSLASMGTDLFQNGTAGDGVALQVVDTSNAAFPRLRYQENGTYGLNSMILRGTKLFGTFNAGIKILDAANPYAPAEFAQLGTGGNYESLALGITRGFHQSGQKAVTIISLYLMPLPTYETENGSSGPASSGLISIPPAVAGTYNSTVNPSAIGVINDQTLLCVDTTQGVEVANVGNPSAPAYVRMLPKPTAGVAGAAIAKCVATSGTLAFVGGRPLLTIYDMSNPAAPIIKGRVDQGDSAVLSEKIMVKGGRIYLGINRRTPPGAPRNNYAVAAIYTASNLAAPQLLHTSGEMTDKVVADIDAWGEGAVVRLGATMTVLFGTNSASEAFSLSSRAGGEWMLYR